VRPAEFSSKKVVVIFTKKVFDSSTHVTQLVTIYRVNIKEIDTFNVT